MVGVEFLWILWLKVVYYGENIDLEFWVILEICKRVILGRLSFEKEWGSYKFWKMEICIVLKLYCVKILGKN